MAITDSSTANASASVGDLITASSTAHTMGAWDEAIASTSEETYWLHLTIKTPAVVTDENFLIDIGVGSVGSEVVQIQRIPFYANLRNAMSIAMPLTIPAGSRVAIRCQATAGSSSLQYAIHLSNEADYGTSSSNITMGALAGASKGTDVDPGAVNNTKPTTFTELEASTSVEVNYLVVLFANSDNNSQTNQDVLVDIAIGAVSAEVAEIDDIPFLSSAVEHASLSKHVFTTIPAGSRVSARCQSSDTSNANDRIIDLCVLGFNITPPAGGAGSGMITHPGMNGGMRA